MRSRRSTIGPKFGSGRPSSLLYTYGPGAIMDLPQFTIMPTGLDDWDRIWRRRETDPPQIHAPRLRQAVRTHMRSPQVQLRPFPWQPKRNSFSGEGNDLGVPARVFPQWLRCTGCDMLAPVPKFRYVNTHPYRTDMARFEHARCPGRTGSGKADRPAVPARYLLACAMGHLDEFPYDQWLLMGRMSTRTCRGGADARPGLLAIALRAHGYFGRPQGWLTSSNVPLPGAGAAPVSQARACSALAAVRPILGSTWTPG